MSRRQASRICSFGDAPCPLSVQVHHSVHDASSHQRPPWLRMTELSAGKAETRAGCRSLSGGRGTQYARLCFRSGRSGRTERRELQVSRVSGNGGWRRIEERLRRRLVVYAHAIFRLGFVLVRKNICCNTTRHPTSGTPACFGLASKKLPERPSN